MEKPCGMIVCIALLPLDLQKPRVGQELIRIPGLLKGTAVCHTFMATCPFTFVRVVIRSSASFFCWGANENKTSAAAALCARED
jgi:hypothetical protein